MIKNKIVYIVLVIVTFLSCLLFKTRAVRFLLGFEIAIVMMSWIMLFFMKRVSVKLEIPYFRVQKNKRFPVIVKFTNRGILPITNIRMRIRCVNQFTGQEYLVRETVMLDGKNTARLELTLDSMSCGKFNIYVENIRVFDYFDIFSRKIKTNEISNEVMILPTIYSLNIRSSQYAKGKHEWEKYSKVMRGEDTSEVFDVHLFRDGDTMQKVHWKLSAKTNEYFVKEFSKPVEDFMMVFLNMDFQSDYTNSEKQEKLDVFLDLVASVSWTMMKQGLGHIVIWYDDEKNELEHASIETEDQVFNMIETISNCRISNEKHDVYQLYHSGVDVSNVGSSLMIDMEGRFFMEQECLKTFEYDSLEKELLEWQLEI